MDSEHPPTPPYMVLRIANYVVFQTKYVAFSRDAAQTSLEGGGSSKQTMLDRGVSKKLIFARTSLMDDPLIRIFKMLTSILCHVITLSSSLSPEYKIN